MGHQAADSRVLDQEVAFLRELALEESGDPVDKGEPRDEGEDGQRPHRSGVGIIRPAGSTGD